MDLTSRSPQSPVSVYHNNSQHHLHLEANHVRSAAPPGRCQSPTASGILTAPPPPERTALPKVGQTRCYWALLTTSLQFLVLDPVLRHHLQDQAPRILDCALLDFVHPDEKESAQRDLGNVLEERTLHGSVTRVRYCRLSRVRRLLGWSDSSLPYPPTFPAERIAIDTDYMAVYLVVNCVANGLVLCFIHAAVDIAPRADNDEFHKTGWSNWCSTYGFEEEQVCALYQRLCETTMPVPKSFEISCDPSLRVLQIFRNQPDRPLVLSWPPDSALFQTGYILPTADDLAQLAQDVQIGYSMGNGGGDDARTSCTRRYKSIQTVRLQTTEGSKTVQVESIFIPHGTIIFACHKVNGAYLDTIHAYSSLQNQRNQQLSQVSGTELGEMGDAGNQVYDGSMIAESQQDLVSQTYVQQWVDGQSQSQQQQDHYTWSDHRGNVLLQGQWHSELQFVEKSLPITARTSDMRAQTSHAAGTNPISDGAGPMALSATPSTSHAARVSDEGSRSSSHDAEKLASVGKDRPTKERYNGCGRGQGSPPAGVAQCAHCQTTHSPEWRKGPSGKKDLCNACGLRFSRSRAKKDGIVSRKRRDKEKEASSNKHSRVQPDFAVTTTVYEAHKAADHRESTQPWPAQTPVINSGEEHSRSNGFSSTRALGHPGANLSAGPVSSTFGFVETTPSIQMPYFS